MCLIKKKQKKNYPLNKSNEELEEIDMKERKLFLPRQLKNKMYLNCWYNGETESTKSGNASFGNVITSSSISIKSDVLKSLYFLYCNVYYNKYYHS